ncbi:MAG: T9SS type A sorting domain-containing protein [Bacteroidetes bacterium]|nr:T9SS type A sorting domain-containing protein [Bacteroidota bacterium]
MKRVRLIPLFFFCFLLHAGKAQIVKEWYFFDQYWLSNGFYNPAYNNPPVSDDSLLFGFVANGAFHDVYKYTHRQGFIKKVRFTGINGYIEAADMCLDTLNKHVYTFSRSGSRPPYYKFSHGIIYKLDYNLNIIDSTIITFSVLYDPSQMVLHNHKLYVAGTNGNYFNEPAKINIGIYDLNLQQLNFKVVTDSSNSRSARKILFDSNNNLRLFVSGNGNTTSPPKTLMILDTNLNILDYKCILNRCAPQFPFIFPVNIVKDNYGFTYSFENYIYSPSTYPFYYIQSYVLRVNETEDTLKSSFFATAFNPNGGNGAGHTYSRIRNLNKISKNRYLALGDEINTGFTGSNSTGWFYVIDSSLKMLNKFQVLKYSTVKLSTSPVTTKMGQTGSGMYYLTSGAIDSVQGSKNVFYLLTIDSTAKLPPVSPTLTAKFEDVFVYPNPTNGIVSIGVPANSSYNISVFNSLGQLLMAEDNINSNRQINLVGLPTGVYHFVFYENVSKKNISKKVILYK